MEKTIIDIENELMLKATLLEKVQFPNGNYAVKLTPELLHLIFNNQEKILGHYEICIVDKQDSKSYSMYTQPLIIGKGIHLKEETLKKIEDLMFNNKFNELIK